MPGPVMQLCVDITLYRLALTADVLSDELRRRYDDALATLKRLGKGEQSLHIAPGEGEEAPADNSPRPIVTSGPERIFTREELRDL